MKKFIITTLAALAAFTLCGCSDSAEDTFSERSWQSGETEITSVSIDVRDRAVVIAISPDEYVSMDYFDSDKEFFDISVSAAGDLTVTAADDKQWSDYIGSKADASVRQIYIELPQSALESLTISTTNEDVTLPALSVAKTISVSVNGGSIFVNGADAGRALTLASKNGNISGTVAGAYEDYAITCDIKKGESNLPASKSGGERALNVTANNGDIDIQFIGRGG